VVLVCRNFTSCPSITLPRYHDFYLILYVTQGGGEHTIDFKTYNAGPGSFFVMTPGQVHSWTLRPGTDGYIIFKELNSITYKLRKLEQLIEKNFSKLKKPGDYANLMNLSPAYLNNLCKKNLGKHFRISSTNESFWKGNGCLPTRISQWPRYRTGCDSRNPPISSGFSGRIQGSRRNNSKKVRFVLLNS